MKMKILLSYTLVTLLFNLQCPSFAKAKLSTNSFTLDVIHRYSPKSPFHNSSMTLRDQSQLLVHHSSLRYRHLISLQNSSNDFNTDIIQNSGDYLIRLSIGVPPVDLFLIVDTGSDLIWVQCQPCNHCYPQNTPLFNPNKSSTFTTVPCNSPACLNSPEIQCDYSTNECQYWYSYGDGSTMTSGIIVKDVFTLDNSTLIFGCGFTQQGKDYDENGAGIVGLSGGPLSLISQLGPVIDYKFSYCLTSSTSNSTGRLTLGSHSKSVQGNVTVKPVMAQLLSNYFPDFYAVTLKAISVGQTRMKVEKDIVIDSGSTLTYLDPTIYSRLEEAVKLATSAKPMVNPPETDFGPCYDKKSGFRGLDRIVLHLSGGDIWLKATNFMIDLGDFVCLGIVPSSRDDVFMILGNVAQMNFEVEFNLDSKMVSFTPSSC